jgi:hypothetical protein
VTNGLKILAESLIIRKIQYIVINYINLFCFWWWNRNEKQKYNTDINICTNLKFLQGANFFEPKLWMIACTTTSFMFSFMYKWSGFVCTNVNVCIVFLFFISISSSKTKKIYIIYYNILYFTIQTLTIVQTNPDHLYMKLNMKLVVVHAIIHSFGSKKLAPCKNFSWLLSWLLTFKTGTWKWHLAIFLAPTSAN